MFCSAEMFSAHPLKFGGRSLDIFQNWVKLINMYDATNLQSSNLI